MSDPPLATTLSQFAPYRRPGAGGRIDALPEFSPTSQLFRDLSLTFFLEHVTPGSRVLDCGCGDGAVSIPLAETGCEVDALDRDKERLAGINARCGDLRIRTHHADIFAAPFTEGTFDYVISRQFLPSFQNWCDVLRMQVKLCKVGGAVIMHHRCKDNAALCEQLASTMEQKTAVRRGYKKRFAASVRDLENFCRENACELEKLTPLSFFTPRAALYRTAFGEEAQKQYRQELEERMQVPEVYNFMRWFESTIIGKCPPALSDSFMAIVRRREAPQRNLRRMIMSWSRPDKTARRR